MYSSPKISDSFLQDIDKSVTNAVKETLQLPNDTPNGMIYAPRKHRGLDIMRAEWEAPTLRSVKN